MQKTNQRIPNYRALAALLLVLLACFLPSCGTSGQGIQILPALKQAGLEGKMIFIVKDVNIIATFSPDGAWMAFISQKGLFVMKPDGSQLTQLGNFNGMGSLNWWK